MSRMCSPAIALRRSSRTMADKRHGSQGTGNVSLRHLDEALCHILTVFILGCHRTTSIAMRHERIAMTVDEFEIMAQAHIPVLECHVPSTFWAPNCSLPTDSGADSFLAVMPDFHNKGEIE